MCETFTHMRESFAYGLRTFGECAMREFDNGMTTALLESANCMKTLVRWFITVAFMAAIPAYAFTNTLIAFGSEWKYLDTGSDPRHHLDRPHLQR